MTSGFLTAMLAATMALPDTAGDPRRCEPLRERHLNVMESFVAALNRHDVDDQYHHYAPDMVYIDGGVRIRPNKESERRDREFEAANNATWRYEVIRVECDAVEVTLTEDMEFYRLLGVGPRSHDARYVVREGKIAEARASNWRQEGRPYTEARECFVQWLSAERPDASRHLLSGGRLLFWADHASTINSRVREWKKSGGPCPPPPPSPGPPSGRPDSLSQGSCR